MLPSLTFNSWPQHPKQLEQVVQWLLDFPGAEDDWNNEELFLCFYGCRAVLRGIRYSSDQKCPCVRGLVARALWVRGGTLGSVFRYLVLSSLVHAKEHGFGACPYSEAMALLVDHNLQNVVF